MRISNISQNFVQFYGPSSLKRVPPAPVNAEDCKRLYKSIKSEAKVANDEIEQKLARYKEIKAQSKKLKEEETKLKNQLVVGMEGNERLVDSQGVTLATYRERKGAAYFNSKGLAEKQTDPDFCQFVSVEYGIRAMFKIINTYYIQYHLRTVKEFITRWAPPDENDTEAYIKTVVDHINEFCVLAADPEKVKPDTKIEYMLLDWVVKGIIFQENGVQPFTHSFLILDCEEIGEWKELPN